MYSITHIHESCDQSKPGLRRTVDLLRAEGTSLLPHHHYEPSPVFSFAIL